MCHTGLMQCPLDIIYGIQRTMPAKVAMPRTATGAFPDRRDAPRLACIRGIMSAQSRGGIYMKTTLAFCGLTAVQPQSASAPTPPVFCAKGYQSPLPMPTLVTIEGSRRETKPRDLLRSCAALQALTYGRVDLLLPFEGGEDVDLLGLPLRV